MPKSTGTAISTDGRDTMPMIEWVLPAPQLRRDHFSLFKCLPPGTPDCLDVNIKHSAEGTERSVAAVYSNRVYLIHYEFHATIHNETK